MMDIKGSIQGSAANQLLNGSLANSIQYGGEGNDKKPVQ